MRMITLKGSPAAKVGTSSRDCSGNDLTVPPMCDLCRQIRRWAGRALSWARTANSRMQAVIGAILKADDDILAAICGTCWVQPVLTCDCLVSQWAAQGLPSVVEGVPGDPCVVITQPVEIVPDCPEEVPSQWLDDCKALCGDACGMITLDPCADVEHLEFMTAALALSRYTVGKRPTAPVLLEALAIAFPGSAPTIIKAGLGLVCVSIGRAMTVAERRFLPTLRSLLPLGFGVELRFYTPMEA
jgi:hypothetical protein